MANFLLPYPIFFLLILPYFIVINAQTINGNISLGLSLTAGNSSALWLSPSEDFAFGFHKLDDDNFLLAIWYYKLPQFTSVWYANGDNPAPRNSKLELTADRGIILKDGDDQELWSSGNISTSTAAVAYAVMNDTGNFQVLDGNSNPIWESFKYPTDTLLPTQFIEIGGMLSSRKSQTNFSRGRFQFRLLEDGNAVLNPINLLGNYTYDAYYASGTNDVANLSNSGFRVIFDRSGYLYVLRRDGSQSFITKPEDARSTSLYYQRVSLNFDGVLTLSSQYKDPSAAIIQTWRTIRFEPENICLAIHGERGTGPCGYNSICSLQSDRSRTNCKCPEGYSLFDPNDAYSGCRSNFLVGCDSTFGQSNQEEYYFMKEIPSTNWPTSDYEVISPATSESCKSSCLHDCLCGAAIFGGERCWKKKLPLSNGREDREPGSIAFLKLRVNNSSPQSPRPPALLNAKDQDTLVIVLSVLLGSSMFVNFIFVGGISMSFFIYYKKKLVGTRPNENSIGSNLRIFSYKELTEATDGFKEELGRGSCGIVYRGETKSSGLIAVKMLDRVFEDNDKEFKAEVSVIGQTHHKNLVRLVGYCEEKQHRLLVYENLRNGTLATFLYGDSLRPSWNQRIQIAYGIARGLVYLHEECSTQIIHCDIKPQNILLDEYYNARISDFGLAKLLLINQSHTKTNIRGTKGYVAPDWFRAAPVSVKVDVYSFGVVLLEIVCCRRNVDTEVDGVEKRILTDWVYDCYLDGKLDALVEYDMEAMSEIKMVEKFVMVALWCLQEDPHIRPTMKKVMLVLEGIVQVSVPPTPFSFTSIN
ncbi:hypothetical protein FNV43_RR26803 [Rhamnella rubrinervis]|uniref:Receptor-like serine/threonine-protein kinase n=1 Tax=Rhamnella rubrinervis TaxID=2594499 RepID=A0A8K0DQ10_9ROSA|nr:hypothetical protein FNV43_RR26803 [Rhamnella rubrinervis]